MEYWCHQGGHKIPEGQIAWIHIVYGDLICDACLKSNYKEVKVLPGPTVNVPKNIENELLNYRCVRLEGMLKKMRQAAKDFLAVNGQSTPEDAACLRASLNMFRLGSDERKSVEKCLELIDAINEEIS